MPLNLFLDSMDTFAKTGRFFVELTERIGDGKLVGDEDVTHLARAFGLKVPSELAGASIVSLEEGHEEKEAEERKESPGRLRMAVTYPPVVVPPDSGVSEKKFKKCFKVCQTVGGAKICAEVCVNIDIGFGGVSGKITATVSVAF
ncbi:hypothetical protein [Rhizobium sp. Root1220]|uniref:hypothetical protein n=1 Tax=Rhizobium sp. Root1220 TaxID=1736432 RepID=UPI0006F26EC9|nr:hypothetical protein [Rhizobium sp. Root1220]KQV81746.1 hypothetical protein ASC90_05420 [Rhizobium sp. Root1220]